MSYKGHVLHISNETTIPDSFHQPNPRSTKNEPTTAAGSRDTFFLPLYKSILPLAYSEPFSSDSPLRARATQNRLPPN